MPYALCPMPYALCPMPYALCPIVPHLFEKGYISLFTSSAPSAPSAVKKSKTIPHRISKSNRPKCRVPQSELLAKKVV